MIDAFRWKRNGILGWGFMGLSGWRKDAVTGTPHLDLHYELYTRRDVAAVRIIYRLKERGDPLEYDIRLQTTQPPRAGIRWWFLCSLASTARRAAAACRSYICRSTHSSSVVGIAMSLTYETRRQDAWTRLINKVVEIRVCLGGSSSLAEEFPAKSPGMQQGTYQRLREQIEGTQDKFFGPCGGRKTK